MESIDDPPVTGKTINVDYKIAITCYEAFDKEIRLKVYAIPKVEDKVMAHKENGRIVPDPIEGYPLVLPELCGMLRILPNADKYWRKIDVVFFNVVTEFRGRKDKEYGMTKRNENIPNDMPEEDKLNKYLAQAYVKASVKILELDLHSKVVYQDKYYACCKYGRDKNGKGSFKVLSSKRTDLINLLISRVQEQYPLLPANSFKIFFLPEQEDHASGFSYQYYTQRLQLCFNTRTAETAIHELLHGMGLPHTFDGLSPNTKYTYEDGKTDNIMDYSQLIGVSRNSLFEWQWYVINPKLNR